MKYSKVTGLIAGLLAAGVAHSAVFFSSEASFLAATGGGAGLTLETYENVTIAGGSTLLLTTPSGLTIASNTPLSDLDNSNFCAGTSDCVSFSTPSVTGSLSIFAFGTAEVNAFGVLLSDLGTVGTTTLTLMTSSGASQSFVIPPSARANERFFGVLSETAFVSAIVSNTAGGDFVTIDNTYFGVPEPTSLLLLGAGLLGLGALRRRG